VNTATAGLRIAKAGCGHDRRQQPLEPLARFGQLGRDTRAAGMDLGADMMRDQAHDALAIGADSARPYRRALRSRSIQSRPSGLSITSTTEASSRNARDRRPERGAQHARAAR
jgi:hypothetical protein